MGKGIPDYVGHASIFIGAMDDPWQQRKSYDTRVTPSVKWTLVGRRATPEKCTNNLYF